jgi:hypothetical protein
MERCIIYPENTTPFSLSSERQPLIFYFKMRNPPKGTINGASRNIQHSTSMPPNGSHETTTKAQNKPKRPSKKYRAVQRPDGIIVEYPRYRPTTLQQPYLSRSDQQRMFLVDRKFPPKETQDVKSSRMAHDLLGVGAFGSDEPSGEYRNITEARGGAYYRRGEPHFMLVGVESYIFERQSHAESNTIGRFLEEPDPWSSCYQREK